MSSRRCDLAKLPDNRAFGAKRLMPPDAALIRAVAAVHNALVGRSVRAAHVAVSGRSGVDTNTRARPQSNQSKATMPRHILDPSHIHAAIAEQVATANIDVVQNVQSAVASNAVLVVGMATNPLCKRALKALDAAGVAHHYLEYGSYLSQWRQRNALKMWTGWPTFPMVFVKGVLVGGADDLKKLIASGELKRELSA